MRELGDFISEFHMCTSAVSSDCSESKNISYNDATKHSYCPEHFYCRTQNTIHEVTEFLMWAEWSYSYWNSAKPATIITSTPLQPTLVVSYSDRVLVLIFMWRTASTKKCTQTSEKGTTVQCRQTGTVFSVSHVLSRVHFQKQLELVKHSIR